VAYQHYRGGVVRGIVEEPIQFGFSLVFVVVGRVTIIVGVDCCYFVVDGRCGERGKREIVSESAI
jgi:hypothetical protein